MSLKTYELQIDVSPKMGKPANTGVTVESFDKDSVLFKITLTQDYEPLVILATDKIQVSVLKYGSPSQKIVLDLPATTGETIKWYPPELLDGYAGRVRVGVYLTRGAQKVAAGYFNFDCKVSDIDANMDAIEDNVLTSFAEFELALAGYQTEAENAKKAAVTTINSKVALVETAKENSLTDIGDAVSAVNSAKTTALQSIDEDTSAANASLNTINQYKQTATDAVTTIDGHLANAIAKNTAVNQKYGEFETNVTTANQNVTTILAMKDSVALLESKAIRQYGVRRTLNATSPLLERIGDSVGKIANVPLDDSVVQNDFDNIYPWSHIKEVIIDNTGRVHYKGEPTYETAVGDWMIEVPLYYAKDVRTETYHDEYVSAFKLPGYYTPKDFIREDGTVCQKVYYGRFKTGKDDTTDVSRPNLLPSNYRGLASFRTGAQAKGAGWQEIGIDYASDFLHRLLKIEFANLNSQVVLGSGITSVRYVATDTATLAETTTNRFVTTPAIANNFNVGNVVNIGTSLGGNNVASMRVIIAINAIDETQTEIVFDGEAVNVAIGNIIAMVAQKTGQTAHLQQPSGRLSGINGRTSVKWRGLEDPFGNLHEWVDGVLVMDNVGYLCNKPSKFASTLTDEYKPLNYINVNENGYPLEMGFDQNYPSAKFPIAVGAGTTTGYADYYYQNSGLRGAFFGGSATHGAGAGVFFWSLHYAPSSSAWLVGGRLLFKPPV